MSKGRVLLNKGHLPWMTHNNSQTFHNFLTIILMTTLGTESELFNKFRQFRDDIMKCQSIAEIADVRAAIKPYTDASPEEGGLKNDLRKVLVNCFKIKEAELYGESAPTTDMNTQDIPKDMQPTKKETAPTKSQTTWAEEVKLPQPTAPLEWRAKEIAEEMKDIDAQNFTDQAKPGAIIAWEPNPVTPIVPEKKTRSRAKPTEESTMEYIPRTEKSVKIYRRINVAINGTSFTNNEVAYEIVAPTQEEAIAESITLRSFALTDIRELNQLMKVQPATWTAPTPLPTMPASQAPTPAPVKAENPTLAKDAWEVFGESEFNAKRVANAVSTKNPAGLSPGHEFDAYNLERLRALFAILRSVDDIEVKLADGSGMLLGAYVTQETQKFGAQFPMAK